MHVKHHNSNYICASDDIDLTLQQKNDKKQHYNKKHRDLRHAWDTIAQYVNDKEPFEKLLTSQSVRRRFGSNHIHTQSAPSARSQDHMAYVDQSKLFFAQLKSNGARTAYQALAFRKFYSNI
jgi:hypothetical protein